jgi:hypothetical protein
MAESSCLLSLSELQDALAPTLLRVAGTNESVFVSVGDQAGVAIVDIEVYRELLTLADRGLTAEIVTRAAEADATGDSVSWAEMQAEWQQDIARWKRGAGG